MLVKILNKCKREIAHSRTLSHDKKLFMGNELESGTNHLSPNQFVVPDSNAFPLNIVNFTCVCVTQMPKSKYRKNKSKSYILTPPHPQGNGMSVKCEQPLDELTVQVSGLKTHACKLAKCELKFNFVSLKYRHSKKSCEFDISYNTKSRSWSQRCFRESTVKAVEKSKRLDHYTDSLSCHVTAMAEKITHFFKQK